MNYYYDFGQELGGWQPIAPEMAQELINNGAGNLLREANPSVAPAAPVGYSSDYVRWAGGPGQPVQYKRPDGTWVNGGAPEHGESAMYVQRALADPQAEQLFKFAYEHPDQLNAEQKAFMANPLLGLDSLGQGARWGNLNLFDNQFNPQQAGALMQTGGASYLSAADMAAGEQFNQEQSPAAQSARDDSGGFGDLLPIVVLIGVGIATGGFGLAAGAVEAGAAAGLTVGEASALAAADAMAGIGATEFGAAAAIGETAAGAAIAESTLPWSQVWAAATDAASTFGALGSGTADLVLTGGLESGFGIGSAAAGTAPGMGVVGSGLSGVTAAEVGSSIAPGIMSSIGAGAVRGAATSAITGNDPLQGAITGGITGGLTNAIGVVDTGLGTTADSAANAAIRGAIGGGAATAVTGGDFSDILEHAALSGIVSGTTAGTTAAVNDSLSGADGIMGDASNTLASGIGGAAGGTVNAALTGGDVADQALVGGAAGAAGGLMTDLGASPTVSGAVGTVVGAAVGDAVSTAPGSTQDTSTTPTPTPLHAAQVTWSDFADPQFIDLSRRDMNWGNRVQWGQER